MTQRSTLTCELTVIFESTFRRSNCSTLLKQELGSLDSPDLSRCYLFGLLTEADEGSSRRAVKASVPRCGIIG